MATESIENILNALNNKHVLELLVSSERMLKVSTDDDREWVYVWETSDADGEYYWTSGSYTEWDDDLNACV